MSQIGGHFQDVANTGPRVLFDRDAPWICRTLRYILIPVMESLRSF